MAEANLELEQFSVADLATKIWAREISASGLTASCFARMNEIDPKVNAVIERNPHAMEIAAALDRELVASGPRGPLHGLPLLIKDNIEIGDEMRTSAGSLALAESIASRDATVVARLRKAGAVILGKTNLSEWANFRSARSSSGWSSRGGQTRNAYALDRSPGGSSSGSAVAVAAGFCVAAIGTETDGSIVSPAAMASIVGIKPTVGLIGRSGIVPISHSQDTAGPMARSVADAAAILTALTGSDPADPITVDADRLRAPDYCAFLEVDGLRGARIGAVTELAKFHDGVAAIFAENLTALRDGGAEVIEAIAMVSARKVRPHEAEVMQTEFKAGINAYLADLGPDVPVKNLADTIAFNSANAERVMPYFPQDLFEASQRRGPLGTETYLAARAACIRLTRHEGIDRALEAHKLDALVMTTTCAPWLIDWANGDNRSGGSAYLAAIAGYPAITVPAGYLYGLPIGLTFVASAWEEPVLIRLAHAFEQSSKHRVAPTFPGTANFAVLT